MSIFTSFNVNASGMTAQRYRMDIISENVANIEYHPYPRMEHLTAVR